MGIVFDKYPEKIGEIAKKVKEAQRGPGADALRKGLGIDPGPDGVGHSEIVLPNQDRVVIKDSRAPQKPGTFHVSVKDKNFKPVDEPLVGGKAGSVLEPEEVMPVVEKLHGARLEVSQGESLQKGVKTGFFRG